MNNEINIWQKRLNTALQAMDSEFRAMDRREELYNGTHTISSATGKAKNAGNVRNIVYELIESEVDSTVPMPQVSSRTQEDVPMAKNAEELLRSEINRLPFTELNDAAERMTTVQGTSAFLVEWEPTHAMRGSTGHLAVSLLHPRQILVQPASADIQSADWLIILRSKTRSELALRYKAFASEESNAEEIVTLYVGYYHNKTGGIGRYIWAEDTQLEHLDNYELPQVYYCNKCKSAGNSGKCEKCGQKAELQSKEILDHEVQTNEETLFTGTKMPMYTPQMYPIVLRKNVSAYGKLFGESDVDKIIDQQETIKKLGSKIDEKVLKGGSYVTLPAGVSVETTDRELKILRVKSPADKAMIDVYNVQPDISKDMAVLEENYQWAKSTLGITDSFQGKRDITATSGVAKRFSVSQAAGRLESKRVMKNAAYTHLFELMFRFLLAYSDDTYPLEAHSATGEIEYREFCRHSFLRKDDANELYWNDDFTFGVDAGGTLAGNRQSMWQETRESFALGAFGIQSTREAQLMYWKIMESLHYPLAGMVRAKLEEEPQEAELPQMLSALANEKILQNTNEGDE